MALTIEAIVDNGTLKPAKAIPFLRDGDRVWITLHIPSEQDVVKTSYGIIGWTGDSETIQRIAFDPEFDILESP
jgi:predicted DNA-binding antitoxin AbrB/MazE fold protein